MISTIKKVSNIGKFVPAGFKNNPVPVKVNWEVSMLCNSRCKFCQRWSVRDTSKDLTTEEGEAEGSVVSSSAQIASDISGSLGTNASLIRTLTAAGISGSVTTVSSSLASRITSEEGEAEGSVVSSSAQIAADISGSLGSNDYLIRN